MSDTILLYPIRGAAGGNDKSVPTLYKRKMAERLLKSGYWSTTPDLNDPKVASSIIERAQTELKQKVEGINKKESSLNEREIELQRQFEVVEQMKKELEAKLPKAKKTEV
jgi:hypothetical protein